MMSLWLFQEALGTASSEGGYEGGYCRTAGLYQPAVTVCRIVCMTAGHDDAAGMWPNH
jgi:hypothetical protein